MNRTVILGSDHAGFTAKNSLREWLAAHDWTPQDIGTHSEDRCDYPDIARTVAEAVVAPDGPDRGILVCGTGLGMSYAANRVPGVRAALCWSVETARLSRDHNDANVLVLPGRVETMDPLDAILAAWLDTPFSGGERHCNRIGKIDHPA